MAARRKSRKRRSNTRETRSRSASRASRLQGRPDYLQRRRRSPQTVVERALRRSRYKKRGVTEGTLGLSSYRIRRNPLQSGRPISTQRRLSPGMVSARPYHEDASARQTTKQVCTRKKSVRRAVIIARGFGGKNNFRNYKEHRSCR